MTGLVRTLEDRCHECYACVRNCPVKAVKVHQGQAEVIEERCINCGNCVRVCSQGAKEIRDYLPEVKKALKSSGKVAAGLAPSFPAYDKDSGFSEWVEFFNSIGIDKIYEVAWGAQLLISEYKNLLKNKETVISSTCPVIVNLIEKYYPQLINYLAPIKSPMMALVEYIKKVEGKDTVIILIGPCLAKKGEFYNDDNVYVLTYSEIRQLEPSSGEKLYKNDEKKIEYVQPEKRARALPLPGGLLEAIGNKDDRNFKIEGKEKVFDLLESLSREETSPGFVDILYCEGCINGIDLQHNNYFEKEMAVNNFIQKSKPQFRSGPFYRTDIIDKLDLRRTFQVDYTELPQPGEKEIWSILHKTGKYSEEDLLNCGACGYNSCREKAVAVYQGLAEVEMCLPYLLNEKRSENNQLDTLIESSYDGMLMLDKEGKIQRVNQAYLDMTGLKKNEVLDRKMVNLESERIIYPSVALLSLKEKRSLTLIQYSRYGKQILATASPVFDHQNRIKQIVVNARDLDKLDLLEEEIKVDNVKDKPINDETGHIIAVSEAMQDVLQMAKKVAGTDSHVLLTGESGVGKEVVARYIHEQSTNRKPFVKINCAAIPESLLESELFGYETGAFSGAKKEGKPGLIEKADGGTLFLDEIGEMPLNMQAKLLQVLQEHRVIRIGGVKSKEVDFRLISATNRDLKEMVDNKEFREDLYYRLNVVPINIPPLRQRKDDIIPLINYFIGQFNNKYNKEVKLRKDSCQVLLEYDWPGNVRELANLLERIAVTTEEDIIDMEKVKEFLKVEGREVKKDIAINDIIPLQEAVARVEKKLLKMARKEGKTTYEMAELLGVNQSTIVRKLKKYFG